MALTLKRTYYGLRYTLGSLFVDDLELKTIERPWIVNPKGVGGMPRESCVPEGLYHVGPHSSEKFPDTYILSNHCLGVYRDAVPSGQQWGRSAILIHTGNTVDDVIGCIAVGLTAQGDRVIDSRKAMDKLREKLGRGNHALTIVDGDA